MSLSIYYEARRSSPLSDSEKAEVTRIVDQYSVDEEIESFVATGDGFNWESFDFKLDAAPGVVFAGSTQLPDNSEEAPIKSVEHWSQCLAELRRAIKGANWNVTVEDAPLHWDDEKQIYDLTR